MKKGTFAFMRRMHVQIATFLLVSTLVSVLILSLIFYLSASSIVMQDGERQTNDSVVQAGQYVQGYLEKVKGLSDMIAMHPETLSALITKEQRSQEALLAMMDLAQKSDGRIVTIAVISKEGFLLSSGNDMAMPLSEDMMDEPWYSEAIKSHQMPALTSTRRGDFTMDKENWVVSVSRDIVDAQGNHLGVVLIDIAYRFIEDYVMSLDLGEKGYVFIVTASGEVVYHPDVRYFEDASKAKSLVEICEMGSGYRSEMGLITFKTSIAHSDWILVGMSSLENVAFLRRQLIESMIMIGGLILVVSLLGSLYLSRRVTIPITKLEKAMGALDASMTHVTYDKHGSLEVTSLAEQYNAMIDRIKTLMTDISINERQMRTFELKALQSQINPHFLYNTLDTIVWLAEFGESEKVVEVTKSLGQLLRLSLNLDQTTIDLADELAHVTHYLEIQKERYGSGLTYAIQGDQALLHLQVPKLILQPIVENAIYHGIREGTGVGHILISYSSQGATWALTVTDNGVGFDPSDSEPTKKVQLSGIGIKNVDQRIKLHYGESFGVVLTSQKGIGTVATFTLPL